MNKTTALRDLPNVTGIIKGSGTSGFSAADEGTDYQCPIALTTIGTQIKIILTNEQEYIGNTRIQD